FVVVVVCDPRAGLQFPCLYPREGSIVGEFRDGEVHGAVGRAVGILLGKQGLDQGDHLPDVLGRPWIALRPVDPESIQVLEERCFEETAELLAALPGVADALDYLVLDVGYVHDMPDPVALEFQVSAKDVLEDEGSEVADVSIVPDGGTAGVEPDL